MFYWRIHRSIFTTAVTWRRPIWLFMFCPTSPFALRQKQLNKAHFVHFTLVSYFTLYKCKIEWSFETAIFLASVVEAFSKSAQEINFLLEAWNVSPVSKTSWKPNKSLCLHLSTVKNIKIPKVKGEAHQTSTSIWQFRAGVKKLTNSTLLSEYSSIYDAFASNSSSHLRVFVWGLFLKWVTDCYQRFQFVQNLQ